MVYGILLMNRDDFEQAGLITIDPRGVLVVTRGKGEWNYGVYRSFMATLKRISLEQPLYKKYGLIGTKHKLPQKTLKYEVRRIALDINYNDVHLLGNMIDAIPVMIGKKTKMLGWQKF